MSKRFTGPLAAALSLLLFPSYAAAQESPPATSPATPDSEQGRVAKLEEAVAASKAALEKLTRLKLSGYVQGRYQLNEATNLRVPAAAPAPATGNDGFSVRRGRLKAAYEGKYSEFVLQLDAVPSGVSVRSAEAVLKLPWVNGWILFGQTEMPFGYETQASSAELALLERSRVVRAFLPGEYDRGVKAFARAGPVNVKVGVMNGNTTDYRGYTLPDASGSPNVAVTPAGLDNDEEKDVLGRLGVDLGWLNLGASGWWGKTLANPALAGTPAAGIPGANRYYDRTRVGADAQLYLRLLPLGATSLKGEYIAGKTPFASNREQLGVSAYGWYAQLQQGLGPAVELAARFDRYDPRSGVAAEAAGSGRYVGSTAARPARVDTFAYGAHWFVDKNLKLSAVHEIPMTERPAPSASNPLGGNEDPPDQLFTVQLQARF
jgi:phosphate-selective porin